MTVLILHITQYYTTSQAFHYHYSPEVFPIKKQDDMTIKINYSSIIFIHKTSVTYIISNSSVVFIILL